MKKRGKVEEAKQVGGHGLNADVWSMGILVKRIAERCRQSSEFATLVTFACVEDRESRPTSAALREKLRVSMQAPSPAMRVEAEAPPPAMRVEAVVPPPAMRFEAVAPPPAMQVEPEPEPGKVDLLVQACDKEQAP